MTKIRNLPRKDISTQGILHSRTYSYFFVDVGGFLPGRVDTPDFVPHSMTGFLNQKSK